jgi:hypothetical protein
MSIVATLIPWIEQRFFLDSNTGTIPNSFGLVSTYETDGSTPKPTYSDVNGVTAHTNPILLTSSGRPPSTIYLGNGGYTFIVRDTLNVPLYTVQNVGGGASAGPGLVATQTLENQEATIGNVAGGEDTLATYTIPANQLVTDGDAIHVQAFGTFENNVNLKRLRMRFGSTTIFDTGGVYAPGGTGIGWQLRGTIVRRSGAIQTSCVEAAMALGTAGTWTTIAPPAETMANAIILVLTGEGIASNDIVMNAFRVTYEPAAV